MKDEQTTENSDVISRPIAGNEISHELSRLQRCVDRHLRRYVEKQVSQTDVYREQHMMLMWLGCHPGATQAQVAKGRDISPAAATGALQKLEKEGYIERQADEKDCRANHVQVTEKGQQVIDQSKQIFQEIDQAIYEGFSEDELHMMKSYYERILDNLKNKLEEEKED